MKTSNSNPSNSSHISSQDHLNQNLSPAEEAVMFHNGPESPKESISNNAVKGGAWLLAILGIFAVCLLITWVVDINHSPSTPFSSRATTERIVQPSPLATLPSSDRQFMANINEILAKAAADKAIKKVVLVPVKTVSTVVAKPVKKLTESVAPISNPSTEPSKSTISKTDADRIEQEALMVIHGDFGNNPGRAEKLGADYDAVQARVNEILHS